MVDLIGSSMLKPSARSPKPCQLRGDFLVLRLALLLALHDPVFGAADAFVDELLGAPDLEPPLVLAELFLDLAHGAAEVERFEDAFFHQRGAAGRLHHGGGHVAARDDRVLRAGRRVHQVGLVEEVAVERAILRVLHQHVAGLADAGQQLVRGLRGEHQRVLGAHAALAHRVVGAVERVEGGVRQPGLVEVQRVDVAVEHVLDGLGVVDHAVVGRLRERHHARLDLLGVDVGQQRVGLDLGLDGALLELALAGSGR
jgi:hypothetical protein